MKIVLIGATGFVGKAILPELLQRGHEVTAIARNSQYIVPQANLTILSADVNDTASLTNIMKGHDAVVSAYNSGWTNPQIYEDFLKGSRSIEKATTASGVKRLIVIGGAGSLYVDGKQLVDTPQFPAEYKRGAQGARDYLSEIKNNTDLEWTFFSPALEMHPGIDTGRTGKYRLGYENPIFNEQNRSILSVEDLAVVIADELQNKQFVRQRFTAAY